MNYSVTLERQADGWWIARVLDVKGVHSNGRSIDEAMRRVREALSLAVDDADDAELVPDVQLPARVKALLEKQSEARDRAQHTQVEASLLQARAAAELIDGLGLSLRDAGSLLGVSHAMASKARRAAPRRAQRSGGERPSSSRKKKKRNS